LAIKELDLETREKLEKIIARNKGKAGALACCNKHKV